MIRQSSCGAARPEGFSGAPLATQTGSARESIGALPHSAPRTERDSAPTSPDPSLWSVPKRVATSSSQVLHSLAVNHVHLQPSVHNSMARLNLLLEHDDSACVCDTPSDVTLSSIAPTNHQYLPGFTMVTTRSQTSRSTTTEPVAIPTDMEMLASRSLISQAADLVEIQSSQSLTRTLDLARRAIVDRTESLEAIQVQKSQEINWVWTHIEELGKEDLDSAAQIRKWQLDLCKEVGDDNLERHRNLSRETLRRMKYCKNRIIENWSVPPEQILDTAFVAQSYLSRPVLQSLAKLSDEVQLPEAKTLLLDRIDTRVQEEQTVFRRLRARGGKKPLGMKLTHTDVKGALEESHKRKASPTPEQGSRKLGRAHRRLLHPPAVHRQSSQTETELDEGSDHGELIPDGASNEAPHKSEPEGQRHSGVGGRQAKGKVSETGLVGNLDKHDVSLDTCFPPIRRL